MTRTAYTPYGQLRGADNVAVDRGWLGQVEDRVDGATGTGLTYLNARYYDPVSMRFISPDPLMNPGDPTTLDPYRYADNNPVMFTDASGLCSTTGHYAYVGRVLEPPCDESNGSQYSAAAPSPPDALHGDTGWASTGGWGKAPSDPVAVIVSNLDKCTTNPNRVGNGTTMDDIRAELETGLPTSGRMHIGKGQQSLQGLETWIRRNPDAPYYDRLVAQSLASELTEVLRGAS